MLWNAVLFSQTNFQYIETPMFVVNPQYDLIQTAACRGLGCKPPGWNVGGLSRPIDLPNCTTPKTEAFYEFRDVSSWLFLSCMV